MSLFKLINYASHPEDLADGRVIAPGEEVKLNGEQAKDDHNKRLIDEGLLVPVEGGSGATQPDPKEQEPAKSTSKKKKPEPKTPADSAESEQQGDES